MATIATIAGGGTLLQTGCARTVAQNVNPCGTIFAETFCDPLAWQRLFVEPQDWERDPTCTIPTLCGTFPPIGEGTGGDQSGTDGGTGTGTDTGTGTGTGTGF